MARKASVVSSPLKLPKAPARYDERDQDHTRRLIELALLAYTQQLGGVIKDIAGVGVIGKEFIPVSPIHGSVNTVGDASNGPFVQLLNPFGSDKIVVIYDLWVNQEGGGTVICRLRTTDTPATLAGTVTTGLLTHRDESDTASITTTLKGATAPTPNPPFATTDATIFENVVAIGATAKGYPRIVRPGMHPVILLPGMALEFMSPLAGATSAVRTYVCFDELAQTVVPGVQVPDDPTAPISSIWAQVRTNGSTNGAATIQFLNPGPRYAKVTGLYPLTDATVNASKMRRTAEPLNIFGPGATTVEGTRKRMNRGSIEQVTCILRGSTFPSNGGTFPSANAFWFDSGRSVAAGLMGTEVVGPGSAPIIVKPGSAIELVASINGSGLIVGLLVFWDELDSV